MHPAFVYLPGRRLSMSELSAARLDGHVVELGEGYIPADLVEGPALRAQSIAPLIPAGTAAAGPTAAWIHGAGLAPPNRHHVCRTAPQRLRIEHQLRLVFHDRRAAAAEIMLLGRVPVTTPAATLRDLLLRIGRDPELGDWVRPLASAFPEAADSARREITASRRVPGRRAALIALSELVQEEVTRYTS